MMRLEGEPLPNRPWVIASPTSFPESVLHRIREIADGHAEIEHEIGGGLASSSLGRAETEGHGRRDHRDAG
jgi:hypothetical protein